MKIEAEIVQILFALVEVGMGIAGFIRGQLSFGLEGTERYDVEVTGLAAKLISSVLLLTGIVTWFHFNAGMVMMMVLIIGGAVYAYIFSDRHK